MFDLVREINRTRKQDESTAAAMAAELKAMGSVLGILQDDVESFLRGEAMGDDALSDADIDSLIQQRLDARKEKNWAEADRFRDQLQEANILLEDGAGGTTWRRG